VQNSPHVSSFEKRQLYGQFKEFAPYPRIQKMLSVIATPLFFLMLMLLVFDIIEIVLGVVLPLQDTRAHAWLIITIILLFYAPVTLWHHSKKKSLFTQRHPDKAPIIRLLW